MENKITWEYVVTASTCTSIKNFIGQYWCKPVLYLFMVGSWSHTRGAHEGRATPPSMSLLSPATASQDRYNLLLR